ncbi:hypothetical protein TG4357_02322 [Thalassovita gelatinovora]|uniref:DUF1127 domain-containing protein n=1 Tax=Thalassovita gelatinovora TaxID=53501 RepID=A0A0P1FDG1_THAGE|nr:hypothetical protein [Thalassovita gelatinovora]QIZ81436.1 hypothetical protein HFZ77_13595 [Thalassovita gelatinovora]CUH66238.1 hypothetical protein TG4357_02322 [Thalassovita gelatinovora]SEQ22258.1 hypothetical protein SAMN04488043_10453 [Thalassovita gelatinovora]
MFFSVFRLSQAHHRRALRGLPRDLPPYLMRDIGLAPWPERPRIANYHLW